MHISCVHGSGITNNDSVNMGCIYLCKLVSSFFGYVLCYACVLSHFSRVRLFGTLWTVAYQAPLAIGFSRQEYWSGLLCPPPGDLPNPGIEPVSPASPALQAAAASVVSDSVRPHRHQPTGFPHPWDSPGKNTGVGCHFLLQCMKVKSESEVTQSRPTLSEVLYKLSYLGSPGGCCYLKLKEYLNEAKHSLT